MHDFNMALKDQTLVWKENTHVVNLPKACTSIKKIFGEQWI